MRVVIGQKTLKERLKTDIEQNKLPRFIILCGAVGSGRQTIAHWIADTAKYDIIVSDSSIATIRELIRQSYEVSKPTIYLVPNAGKLVQAAQNALLKVTEEPSPNAYWIFTVENKSQLLDTLNSRGFYYNMDVYSERELNDYMDYHDNLKVTDKDRPIVLSICETPGDIELLVSQGVTQFKEYVDKVVNNIAVVSGSNSFKIGSKIALKGEENKFDLALFLKAFMRECFDRSQADVKRNDTNEDTLKYAIGIRVTSKYLQELQMPSINKMMLFDAWLLEIRENWL